MTADANPYLGLMQSEEDRQRAATTSTLSTAIDVNPDQAATQRRVADLLGYTPAVVEATPDASAREAKLKQIETDIAPSPVLRGRYSNADFAKLAHDDSGVLSKVEAGVGAMMRYVMGANYGGNTLAGDIRGGLHEAAANTESTFRAGLEAVAPVLDPLADARILPANPLRGAAAEWQKAAAGQKRVSESFSPPSDGLVQGGVSSGVKSVVAQATTLPATLLNPPAGLVQMVQQTFGGAFEQISTQKPNASMAEKLVYASSQGLIEYATERIPLERLVGDINAATPFFKMITRQVAAEIPGEQLATVLQDMNEWAALPANANKSFKEYLAERPSAAAQTLIATVIGVGGNVAIMKSIQSTIDAATGQQNQIVQADTSAEQLQQVLALAAQSKLRERDPATFTALVQEMAERSENAPTEVWFDARTLVGANGEGGLLNQEQVQQLIPSVLPQLADALASGGAVSVPIGELVGNVTGTPVEQTLLQNLRTDVDALSQAEAKQAGAMAEAFLQSEAQRVIGTAADQTAIVTAAEQVKAEVLRQLNAANRFTPEVHDAYASLVRDFYTTMSGRLGITPDQMYAQYPLRIAGVNPASVGLTQSAYHGTAYRGIQQFSTKHIGKGEGAQVYGWGMYFAGNAQVAEFYRKTVSQQKRMSAPESDPEILAAEKRLDAALEAFQLLDDRVDAKERAAELRAAQDAYEAVLAKQGQLYHVEVPNDDQLLDRDAPLSAQPEAVRKALQELGINVSPGYVVDGPHGKVQFNTKEKAQAYIRRLNLNAAVRESKESWQTGADAYRRLEADLGSDQAASLALAAAGVPGLRYLDADSRGGSTSKTYNYVIFQDDAVRKLGEFYQSRVKQATPAVTKLLKNLTDDEQKKITDKVAAKIVAQLTNLPSAKEMAAVAYAGKAKRGWYAKSAQTILDIFGADAPRFAALLAAMSPQTSVENNLFNALQTWKNWIAAGRPQEKGAIVAVMGRSVMGSKLTDSVLPAWINNSVRALTHDDPGTLILSGPKVNSFFRNLIGHVNEVTNDAWMANFALVNQTMFAGGLNKAGTDPGKGTGYLAMNARVREAAKELTKLTGDMWTPAEVQETIWSWAKTLYELAESATETRSARQIVEEGGLTDDLINSTPDFGTLFHNPTYATILTEAGYGQELDDIAQRAAAEQAEQGSEARGQAAPFAPDAQRRYELAAARRLERLAEQRGNARDAGEAERADAALDDALAEANEAFNQSRIPGSSLTLDEPLRGLPQTVKVDGEDVTFGPFVPAREAAMRYMARAGLPYTPPTTYAKVDKERAQRIARAFTRMFHDPTDPKVKASYEAMIAETIEQYRAILETGLQVEFNQGEDPYGNPRKAILDVVHNNHLFVFSTKEGFGSNAAFDPGDNPLLGETEFTDVNGKPMLVNDVFRVVHDYFGHIKEGNGFRADGEENAWRSHVAMYSPLARGAMTTETRGQNSWVNFGPHAVANAKASGADTIYADQKIGLLPEWVVTEGAGDGTQQSSGPVRDGTAAANGGRSGPQTVVRQEGGQVSVRGVHYSTGQRARLDGRHYGTGLKGAERARIDESADARLKSRVYLYVDEGSGIRPETGVGSFAHRVDVSNLYDINANPLKLPTYPANDMESAILDAGFDGYYVPKVFNGQGVAVIIGDASHNVAVTPDAPLEQGPRGSYSPSSLSVSLLEGADLSTFLHETGHFFLDVMTRIASSESVPLAVANDTAAVLKWFGVKAGDNESALATWRAMSLEEQRPFHEKFAEAFEQYLFEGKAPNQELQPLFAKVRSWMTSVYRTLKDFLTMHNTQLTPTVRGVFDRLLASEQSIAEAEQARAYAPLFKSAEEAGMTPAEWAAYQAVGQQATEKAISELEARSLRDMRWASNTRARALREAQKDTEAKRAAVEAEVRAELEATQVEQARAQIKALQKAAAARSAEHKAARKAWVEKYDAAKAETAAAVRADAAFTNAAERKLEVERRMLGWETEHPAPLPELDEGELEAIAAANGYSSADEMDFALRSTPPISEVLEGLVDRRLLERFGDLTTAAGMQRAADEAVHNDARARFIATGLNALSTAARQGEKVPGRKTSVNVITKAARQYAEGLIARRKIRDVKPAQYLAAETRAGKLALEATAKGDTQLAISATRDQLLNHYSAREAQAAQAEIEKRVAWLRKFQTNTTLPPEYRDQIDVLLDRFDLRDTPLKTVDKRKTLAQWIESQRAIGVEPELPPGLLDEARRQNYRDMTVEEFRGLVDAVKQIDHLGRLKDKLLTAKDQREFEATRDAIAQSIIDEAGDRDADTRTPTTNAGRALKAVRDFGAAHIKAATIARVLDGGKDGGPVWEYFVRSANERGDFEVGERAKATAALTAILAPWMNAGKLGGAGKFFPGVNRSFNRESLLAIALNTGNAGNLQRLLGGEGWTEAQLQPMLQSLTRSDWETVQRVWDYIDSFRPQIKAKQLRVYGTEPDWVEPVAREQLLNDGTTVKLTGGYYPIKYDPAASVRAEEHTDAEGARRALQGAYGAATTRRSFTKTRAEEVTGRPLLYTLSGVFTGVNDVIHDLAWHEWLIDTNRLLKSTAIDSAIREHYGPAFVRQLKTWRDAIAEGDGAAQEALDTALGRLRQGVSVAGLGFNVMSAAIQPLGLTQSIVRVGAKWIGKGLWQYIASPMESRAEVIEKSAFMENRARTFNRELNELQNRVRGETDLKRYAYVLMAAAQSAVDTPTWLGAYEKAIAGGNEDARAVQLADQAVIDSQGSGRSQDLSAIERGGPAQKLFTVFYGFMNTALNMGVAQKMTPGGRAKFAVDMALLYVVPAVLSVFLKNALTPGDSGDDKDWKTLARKLLAEQISYLMGLMVVSREFAEAGKTMAGVSEQPRDYAGPAGVRVISDATRAAQQVSQGEFDDPFRKAMVNLGGSLLGLPAAQINRSVTGAQALREGKTRNPAALVFGYQEPR